MFYHENFCVYGNLCVLNQVQFMHIYMYIVCFICQSILEHTCNSVGQLSLKYRNNRDYFSDANQIIMIFIIMIIEIHDYRYN